MIRTLSTLILALAAASAMAGEHNEKLNIGDKAPEWKNLPGTDGKKHSLSDLKDKKLLVVVFTCNSCPVAENYEDRIIAFAKKHADSVGVVAISVSREPDDSMEKLRERATKKKFTFPYLYDESQQIARDYGAAGTPEFFLLSTDRKIAYMGAMDDSDDFPKVKTQYLEPAVQAAIEGKKPEVAETFAHGCRIRFARQKRQN